MHSAVLIIPAALHAQANAVGEAMGWGPTSYTVPLSTDGETVTHWGCRADVGEQFVRWIKGVDPLPDETAQPVVDALIADFRTDPTIEDDDRPVLWGREHFDAVLGENQMAQIEVAS